ncbi:hypothetical protein [Herbiconiux sp. UC225_62]|uniref:hypothetical protein n=1 Tax=Herbiconiux sp. UC225_62 TaxID=3350168 RepID=UPI0036D218E2
MIAVLTSSPAYRVAIAGLPLSTQNAASGSEAEAIVVIDGAAGWTTRAARAADQGAAAIVVADPQSGRLDELALRALAARLPVVLDRPHLRRDVVADALAGEPARSAPWAFVTAHCSAPAGVLSETLTDALGWLREIAGPLELTVSRGAGEGVLASLRGARGGVSLTVRRLGGAGPRISVTAVAPRRLEVTLAPGALPAVRWTDAVGASTPPARFENRERLSLRRAVSAIESNELLSDVHDYLADASIAAELRQAMPT